VAELYLSAPCCSEEENFNRNQNRFILNSIHGVLLYSLGAISTLLITEVGKHTIGRLRPHFIDVCKPDWEQIKCFEDINGQKVAKYLNIEKKYDLIDKNFFPIKVIFNFMKICAKVMQN
jgi:hypothetical protein